MGWIIAGVLVIAAIVGAVFLANDPSLTYGDD